MDSPFVLPSRTSPQFQLRLTDALLENIKQAAAANGRSMNAEINFRLNAFQQPTEADMAKGSTLTIRLSDETRAKLDEITKRGPYRISITSVVERGIELAAEELARIK